MGTFGLSILLSLILAWPVFADTYTNVSGTWKPTNIYTNVSGTWKPVDAYCNVSGVWKPCSSGGCQVCTVDSTPRCITDSITKVYAVYGSNSECLTHEMDVTLDFIRISDSTRVGLAFPSCNNITLQATFGLSGKAVEGVSYSLTWNPR